MPKFIKDWKDLVGLESEHYKLEINVDGGNGWIVPKDETDEEFFENSYYLSTHTFYGRNYKRSTEVLQRFGFDVELDNWDKEGDDNAE